MAQRSWAEPWKIKMVEPITMRTRDDHTDAHSRERPNRD